MWEVPRGRGCQPQPLTVGTIGHARPLPGVWGWFLGGAGKQRQVWESSMVGVWASWVSNAGFCLLSLVPATGRGSFSRSGSYGRTSWCVPRPSTKTRDPPGPSGGSGPLGVLWVCALPLPLGAHLSPAPTSRPHRDFPVRPACSPAWQGPCRFAASGFQAPWPGGHMAGPEQAPRR